MTLRDFKAAVDRQGSFRYHFKALDPEFGTVKEEVGLEPKLQALPVLISNSFRFTQTHLDGWCKKSQIITSLFFPPTRTSEWYFIWRGCYVNTCWLCRCSRTEQSFPAGRGRLWRGWRRTTAREGRAEKPEITANAANLDSARFEYLWCHNRHDKNVQGPKDVTQVRHKWGSVFKKWMFHKLIFDIFLL